MDNDLVITIRLRPEQINLILAKLGQCPFTEVVEVISTIKQQGDAAIQAARQQAAGNGVEQIKQSIE